MSEATRREMASVFPAPAQAITCRCPPRWAITLVCSVEGTNTEVAIVPNTYRGGFVVTRNDNQPSMQSERRQVTHENGPEDPGSAEVYRHAARSRLRTGP